MDGIDKEFDTWLTATHLELREMVASRVNTVRNAPVWWVNHYDALLKNFLTSKTMTRQAYIDGLMVIPGLTPMDICLLADFADTERPKWIPS